MAFKPRIMKMQLLLWSSLLATGLVCGAQAVDSTELWADPQLPVRDGLMLWLDASRQNAARHARQLPAIADNAEVDVWFDGSGHGLHLSQAVGASRPRLRLQAGGAA